VALLMVMSALITLGSDEGNPLKRNALASKSSWSMNDNTMRWTREKADSSILTDLHCCELNEMGW